MKMIVAVALALVAFASAAPVDEPIPIVRSAFEQVPEGGFHYSYETGNNIVQEAVGEPKSGVDADNKPVTFLTIRGSYSYIGEDGQPISIKYYADESGFHPEGDSIPKVARR